MEKINVSPTLKTFEEWWVGSHYRRFVQNEGLPLYEGSALENLATLPLTDWERRGGKAAYRELRQLCCARCNNDLVLVQNKCTSGLVPMPNLAVMKLQQNFVHIF